MLSPYNVTYMYVFRANSLVLDDQLVCPSLEKLFLLLWVSLGACGPLCRAEAPWPFPSHGSLSIGIVLVEVTFR